MAVKVLATAAEIRDMKRKFRDIESVTRCYRCEKWRNFTLRPNNEAKPDDLGLCDEYSRVKEACGYCDKGKEKKDG